MPATGSNGGMVGNAATRTEYLKYCVPDTYCYEPDEQSNSAKLTMSPYIHYADVISLGLMRVARMAKVIN